MLNSFYPLFFFVFLNGSLRKDFKNDIWKIPYVSCFFLMKSSHSKLHFNDINCLDIFFYYCRTWLLTGELYLRLGQVDAAELCANEARQVRLIYGQWKFEQKCNLIH